MRYKAFRNLLRKFRIDISPYPNGSLRRKSELLDKYKIDLILDVGASDGGFANQIRSIGYRGRIISFEPISTTFSKLLKKSRKDDSWTALNFALGNKEEEKIINISQNKDSSSFLKMNDNHLHANPNSIYTGSEKVIVKKLDSIFNKIKGTSESVFIKLDVQGYEKEVLDGGRDSLKSIKGIQIEMSFEELYEGSFLFDDIRKIIENDGFTLCLLESGNRNKETGKLLQVDGVFFKIER